MNLTDLVARADQILELGDVAFASRRRGDYGTWVDEDKLSEFRSAALSFLANTFGSTHRFYTDFVTGVPSSQPSNVGLGIGVLRAARNELAGGWLRSARGLLCAEILGDFLEMADHLAEEHNKDAAAVIAGSVLEEHLRQLAAGAEVAVTVTEASGTVPKKLDALNADLARESAYSKLDQKSIAAWLDLRNKAAHGKYSEYDEAQVRLMIEGVRQFMGRAPV
jgi:hypothetical protein